MGEGKGSKGRDKDKDIGRRVGEVVGEAVSDVVGGVLSTAVRTVGKAGHLLVETFRLPGLEGRLSIVPSAPGDAPGIDSLVGLDRVPPQDAVRIRCIDYASDRLEETAIAPEGLSELGRTEPPDWVSVRWLVVQGLHPYVVNELRHALDFHTLSAEDVLRPPQRPRAEAQGDHLFIVSQFLKQSEEGMRSEQISMFLYDRMLITFQESHESLWEPLEARLQRADSRMRQRDASYLAYAILDMMVDHAFPVLEDYAVTLEQLEDGAMEARGGDILQRVHHVKRDLAVLRRILWPVRELVMELRKAEHDPLISEATRAFLSDVQDHSAQLVDMTETFRDLAGSVTELYVSISSHRMNEIMQVLTVISTIFIPISFLAGVFGMNFRVLPGLEWEHGYMAFWGACLSVVGGLLWFFRRRGWFG